MATTPTETITAEPDLVLTPPDPVPVVSPTRRPGWCRSTTPRRASWTRASTAFVDDLVAQDVNSPEFGKRVDAITSMGQKEIRDAAGQSNRFLDRPVKAMDKESGVGADLGRAAPRRSRSSIPASSGKSVASRASCSASSRSATSSTTISTVQIVADAHLGDPQEPRLGQGRAADGQCRDRYRARQSVDGDGPARADDPPLQDDGREAGGQGQRARRDRPGQGQGDPRDRVVLRPPAHARIC